MRLAVRNLALGLLVSMFFAGPASAQYMKITTDNPSDNTAMRATGTTILTITLDTDHDKNASLQTCNSHTAANACGSITTSAVLDLFSYTLALKASGGTVTWGTFTPSDAAYTDAAPLIFNDTEIEINKARPSGTVSPAGLNSIGTIPVTPVSGSPSVGLQIGAGALNPFGFGTGFGTDCSGFSFPNTYVVGDPADPCGNVNGVPGDWFDWDGARSASGEAPPSITAPATATGAENTAITPITATATDPDAGNTLTITQTGVPAFLTFSSSPAPSPNTATVSGTPGFSDSGPYSINWHVDDGAGGTANTSTQLTITNTDRPPTLAQPADMTVNEGSTAEQTITGSDPDADPLTFAVVDGPGYLSVQNSTATTGTIRLVPGFTSAGTAGATVSASDGTLFDNKSFSITVNNTNRAPLLAQPANMSVAQGATADQAIQATDPDGDPLTFSRVSGATFLTVTTTAPGTGTGTGNIHLAPGGADPVGTSSATVRASDATLTNDKNLTITVVAGANQPPVLTQPANVTVNEGATANNPLSATDADGQALTFAKVSGPTYATVTTTTPGTGTATGNVALAPGFSDSGTATVSVSASDGAASDTKSFTVTVNNTDRAPTLDAVANMTVAQGATADQVITASDPDGDALTFSQISGPTFMTVTTTNPTTGNIHLAAGASEPLGVTASSVRATDGSLNSNVQPFTVTVTAGANQPPVLAQPADMTVNENATADQVITATDGDGNPLTFTKVSGPTFLAVTTTSPGTGSAMGNIHLGPGFDDAGTYGATVRASDGSLNSDKSLNVTVNNVNRAPTLNPISNMTVTEGQTADQSISGSDPDGDALTFSKVTGPTFLTITTSTPTTGNVHVAPLTGDSGASPYTVQGRASDGTDQATRIFSVTVQPPNRAPVLAQPSDVTVNEGDTADQTLNATDPDGDAVTFSLVSGPTYASVTTTSPGNGTAAGNLHLAPGFSDAGTAGATVRASDGALSDDKSLTITVDNVNRPPTLNQPTNMAVAQGTTADQVLTGSDPDGDALT
ncbi:MAG TPA: Ig-like domain-containing protein, partial [Candidatus Binatia bacterium]|nr:Ig-like domain-containing protein [Candidatus Binatia bacterium]